MKKKKMILGIFIGAMLMMIPSSTFALTKSETIYSNLEVDGTLQHSSVSNHLAFLDSREEADETTLKDILNINGDEKFRLDGNKIIWENKGRDIFYRGTCKDALPISVKVEYFLNGKRVNPKKIIGKKGDVKIIYHFTNQEKKIVTIDHKAEEVYTPFVVSIGMFLDGKNNKDFMISEGKVISTGTRNMVLGLSAPGLYESTGIDAFYDLDHVTLTYSTTSFSLPNVYIVATPKLLSQAEVQTLGRVDELYKSMNALDENMQKIVDGSSEISTGTHQAYEGSQSLSYNMKKLRDASSQLKNGSSTLSSGLTTLKNALYTMQEGISQKLQGQRIEDVMMTLQNLKTQNNAVIENTLQKCGKSFDQLESIYVQNNLKDYQGQGNGDPFLAVKESYELILLLTGNNTSIDINLTTLSSLSAGSLTLQEGLTTLENGSSQLYQGSITLEEGMRQLVHGSNQLNIGTKSFQERGIKQLALYSKTVKNYSSKIEALTKLSREYSGFASHNSDSTLFVYTIKSIKK